MSVTAPAGFVAAGVAAGMRASGRPDLGLLVAEAPATAAGFFTRNAFPAAPVVLSRDRVGAGRARAVVVNSGQANAGTGKAGHEDARAMSAAVAAEIGIAAQDVLICSTGVIGPRVKLDAFHSGIPTAAAALRPDGGTDFATAILTTDTVTKEATAEYDGIVVGGCAKGAGMIAPDLATMLTFVTTDAQISASLLREVALRAVLPAFSGLTIDGCASTNDTVLVLASGAGVAVDPGTRDEKALELALRDVSTALARGLAADAEGATTTLVVQVAGAVDDDHARAVGRGIAGSMLVKAAVFGADPNVGRLLQAVGAADTTLDPSSVSISLAGFTVVSRGAVVPFDQAACARALRAPETVVQVDLGAGTGEATCFGCDLSYEYVRINAEYRT